MIILGVSGPQWLSEEWVGPGCRPWCVYEGWFAKLGVGTLAVMQGAVFFSVMCWLLAVGGVEVALDMWSSWTWRGAG